MLNLSNEIKMDIYANRHGLFREPLRAMQDRLNIDHVTLMRKSSEIKVEIESSLKPRKETNRLIVSTVISLAMMGQMASRPIAAFVRRILGIQMEHDTVLNILNLAGQAANDIQNSTMTLANAKTASFDEIFQNSNPLLVFTNNQSSVSFLKKANDRKEESWSSFIEELKLKQLDPTTVVGDGGPGLGSAIDKSHWGDRFVIDIFHCLEKTNEALRKMESICYALLEELYKKESKDIDRRVAEYKDLKSKTDIAIDLYDKANALLTKFRIHVRLGDPSEEQYIPSHVLTTEVRDLTLIFGNFIETVSSHRKIKSAKSYLTNYQNQIALYKKKIESAIQQKYPEQFENIVNLILPIVEYYDRYERSYENLTAQKYWADQIIITKNRAMAAFTEADFNLHINEIALIAAQFSRSNSNIENLNNQIRRYFEVYKSIPEWFPYLFSFYWNFRVFERGKRKGYAPIEILLGGKLKTDWLDLILEKFPYEKVRI